MTSLRNNVDADRSTSERLLAAARACILDVGWKRTTLTDVANRAEVSRMTVYRTFSDMPTLFAELMTQESAGVVAEVIEDQPADRSWPERIAGGVSGTVLALRDNELFRRAVDLDPEWLLPYLLDRRGRSQDGALDVLTDRIAEGQSTGEVRSGDPVVLARSVVLAAHGFALSLATMTDEGVSAEALDAELGELVRRYLAA
jgi:AcrR family transcriptional regulator